jgi:hypothetical protein
MSDGDNIVFIDGEFAFGNPLVFLRTLFDEIQFYYECRNNKSPFKDTIVSELPYVLVQGQTPYYIPAPMLKYAIEQNMRIVILRPLRRLPHTTSLKSVQIRYGRDYQGNSVDFISADHCQDGSDKMVYEVLEYQKLAHGGARLSNAGIY